MGILREISKLEIFSPHENSRMNWAFLSEMKELTLLPIDFFETCQMHIIWINNKNATPKNHQNKKHPQKNPLIQCNKNST